MAYKAFDEIDKLVENSVEQAEDFMEKCAMGGQDKSSAKTGIDRNLQPRSSGSEVFVLSKENSTDSMKTSPAKKISQIGIHSSPRRDKVLAAPNKNKSVRSKAAIETEPITTLNEPPLRSVKRGKSTGKRRKSKKSTDSGDTGGTYSDPRLRSAKNSETDLTKSLRENLKKNEKLATKTFYSDDGLYELQLRELSQPRAMANQSRSNDNLVKTESSSTWVELISSKSVSRDNTRDSARDSLMHFHSLVNLEDNGLHQMDIRGEVDGNKLTQININGNTFRF